MNSPIISTFSFIPAQDARHIYIYTCGIINLTVRERLAKHQPTALRIINRQGTSRTPRLQKERPCPLYLLIIPECAPFHPSTAHIHHVHNLPAQRTRTLSRYQGETDEQSLPAWYLRIIFEQSESLPLFVPGPLRILSELAVTLTLYSRKPGCGAGPAALLV